MEASRFRGFQVRIKFNGGHTRWFRPDDLEVLPEHPHKDPGETAAKPTRPKRPCPAPLNAQLTAAAALRLKYRRMVEAFKLGIVPDEAVREFTFGRTREISFARGWLKDPDRNVLLLVGEYGTGKTHLLEYLRWDALRNGYACAMIELDANESPLHKPRRVYQRLIQNFRYKNRTGAILGFRDFVADLGKLDTSLLKHKFIGPLLRSARASGVPDQRWEWMEGQESWLRPRLYDHSTCANLYCNILSGLASGATELGLQGLLLIFDEAETLDVGATSYQLDKGLNFIRGLAMTCDSDQELNENVFDYGGDGHLGEKSSLRYSGHYPGIPFIWKRPSCLKSLFGFAPSPIIGSTSLNGVERLELSGLSERALREVFQHLCDVYKGAHGFLPDQKILDKTFRLLENGLDDSTRKFMKTTIETMDIRRLRSIGRIETQQRIN